MTGIYDCFGYGSGYEVSFDKRYRLIKQAGFDCVMLWWSDRFGRGYGYRNDARLARNAGLFVENIHAPVHEQNYLSSNGSEGESVYNSYLQYVSDCVEFRIPEVVIHLPSDDNPINRLGFQRLRQIVHEAENGGVKIAFENLNNIQNLAFVLDSFRSEYVGFCYDSCHHINYAPEVDLLKLYGDRLMALHLYDNGGKHNQHQLPLDGGINWILVMNEISRAGYKGAVSLEPMNWDYEHLSIRQFLELAYQRAKQIDAMRRI